MKLVMAITPASGFVQPMPSFIFGLAAGVVCYFACTTLKQKLGYDDPRLRAGLENCDLCGNSVFDRGYNDAFVPKAAAFVRDHAGGATCGPCVEEEACACKTETKASSNGKAAAANLDDLVRMYSRDVSVGGMFLPTTREIPLSSELRLEIRHPHADSMFHMTAVVRRRSAQPAGIGVEFVGLDDRKRRQFFEFIHAPLPTAEADEIELLETE